ECAPFVLSAVQTLDGCSRFRLTPPLDEAAAPAPARVAIGDHLRALHIAECTKQYFEARTIDTEAQVTDVQLLTHCDELSLTRTGYPPAFYFLACSAGPIDSTREGRCGRLRGRMRDFVRSRT